MRVDVRKSAPFDHAAYMGGGGFADIHSYRSHGSGFVGDLISGAVPLAVNAGVKMIPGVGAVDAMTGGLISNAASNAIQDAIPGGRKRRRR